jgi:large subunit ribosomal protein L31e
MPANNYIIPLKKAYDKPRTRRANVSVKLIFDFLEKHTRKSKKDVILSKEVNEFIWKRSIEKPPRKIEVSLKEKDGKYYVFLKDSKEIEKFIAKQKEKPKKKSIKEQVSSMAQNFSSPQNNQTKESKTDKSKDGNLKNVSNKSSKDNDKSNKDKLEVKEENTSTPKEDTSTAKEDTSIPKEVVK